MFKFFEICFYTGVLFSIIAFIFGHFLNIVHLDGLDLHIDTDLPDAIMVPLRPIILTSFAVVFGGIGMMMLNAGYSDALALTVSIVAGITVSFCLNRFIIVPLRKAQNTSSVSQNDMIGTKAVVILGMKGDSFGEIRYTVCGNSYTSPAKSTDGSEIPKDTEVVILDISNDVFYVGNHTDREEGN